MNDDLSPFLSFARRILRAASKRVGNADVEDLAALVALRSDVDEAIARAVVSVHASGSSWRDIADALGMSRQAAHKRWSSTVG